jgi:hypothetical protein
MHKSELQDGHKHSNRDNRQDENKEDRELGPYWRRAHADWRFWVGVVLISVAIAVYVVTVDLSMVPRMFHRAAGRSSEARQVQS